MEILTTICAKKKVGKFGKIAVVAAELLKSNNSFKNNPIKAWDEANVLVSSFENKKCYNKDCPKNTFIAICNEGLLKNVPSGNYGNPRDNREYALLAVKILSGSNITEPKKLWVRILKELAKTKTENGQADLILSLWTNGYIVTGLI